MSVILQDRVEAVVLAEVRDMAPVSARQIAEGTGLSESAVRRALTTLEERGHVEADDYQRRGRVWMEADSNPTGAACGATARLSGVCDRSAGMAGTHHDAAGNAWDEP